MTSCVRSSSEHFNITDRDDFGHCDSAQYPLTLPSDDPSALICACLEAAEVNERMSSEPTPRYKRPRRIELTSDQNDGAPEMAEVDEIVVNEAVTSFCNGQTEELLVSQEVQRQHLALVCCFSF